MNSSAFDVSDNGLKIIVLINPYHRCARTGTNNIQIPGLPLFMYPLINKL